MYRHPTEKKGKSERGKRKEKRLVLIYLKNQSRMGIITHSEYMHYACEEATS
jgi:hypothetical protein